MGKKYRKYLRKGIRDRRRKRQEASKKSKKYTVSIAKLASKKIDTLLERRMVEISQAQRIKLISRRYFSTVNDNVAGQEYNQVFGIPENAQVVDRSNNWSRTRFQTVGTEPVCYTLTAISAQDINQPLNQMINPTDVDGVTQGMTTQDQHGRRRGKFINVTGISLDLRVIHDWGILEQDPALTGAHDLLRSFLRNTGGKATVYWKIVMVPSDPIGTIPVQTEGQKQGPAIASVKSEVPAWGYSTALDYKKNNMIDFEPTVVTRKRRLKVLHKGKIKLDLRPRTTFDVLTNFTGANDIPYQTLSIKEQKVERSYYVPFPDPIKIEYAPTDQDGIQTMNQSIYLVICSDVDITQATTPIERYVAPRVSMVTKLYYFEP